MVRLAHLITGSNAVAEEIVQEAFIRLQRQLAPGGRPLRHTCAPSSPTSAGRNCAGATASGDSTNRLGRHIFNPRSTRRGPPSAGFRSASGAALALRFYEDLEERRSPGSSGAGRER